ncbi:hypothetical protein N9H93_04865, partial [Rhizobiaceae bacterium]|nr:hypothetical protein [Rhizobiaceae bacterium]
MSAKPTTSLLRPRASSHPVPLALRLEAELGLQPPLQANHHRRSPDRRRVSLRWLAGTVLTGITSLFLMGGALYAALDGRPLLARPADAMSSPMNRGSARTVSIGGRVAQPIATVDAPERVLLVPTRTTVGNQDVIRKRPFAYAEAPLAIAGQISTVYPDFDPLAVFRAAGDDEVEAAGGEIYVADIESEVVVSEESFTPETSNFAPNSRISL